MRTDVRPSGPQHPDGGAAWRTDQLRQITGMAGKQLLLVARDDLYVWTREA